VAKTKVAVYASGNGSNAKVLIEKSHQAQYEVALVVCNKPNAGVLQIAAANNIPTLIIEKERFAYDDAYLPELRSHQVELIVLAGFLWKIPALLVDAFYGKIINIHPALLPKYGGKGMYGMHVHKAVVAAKEQESGITIHYVNEVYDDGEIILQAKCAVLPTDTAENLAQKIHVLEHEHYWQVVNTICN
jgi:phosphoribosylglycinamide formyltransferase-1